MISEEYNNSNEAYTNVKGNEILHELTNGLDGDTTAYTSYMHSILNNLMLFCLFVFLHFRAKSELSGILFHT